MYHTSNDQAFNFKNNNNPETNEEKKSFQSKLYLDPIESFNNKISQTKTKGFRIKKEQPKTNEEDVSVSLPNVETPVNNLASMNKTQGSMIIQNWETARNIPEDIGDLIHFPVLVDRNKFKIKKDEVQRNFGLTSVGRKFNFDKDRVKKDSLKPIYIKESIPNLALTLPPNYLASQNTQNYFGAFHAQTEGNELDKKIDKNLMTFQMRKEVPKELSVITPQDTEPSKMLSTQVKTSANMPLTMTQPVSTKIDLESKKASKLIDFSTFNKHLYLRDNDFLYAKRVGGPVDYVLCSYQEINNRAKVTNNTLQSMNKKKLPSIKKKNKIGEYITISKNTVLHYQKGVPIIYSIQEWIGNYNKYKLLMKIPLFKNFKNAKLFDSWRRFYKKTKRQYYTEKLKSKFFFIDKHLLNGILETRNALKPMKVTNIFDMKQSSSVLLNHFNELHKLNLVDTDKKIEQFRNITKNIILTACNNSYQDYKLLKKITLDDDVNAGGGDENDPNDKKKKKDKVESNIQNFIKNAIPYAQDATRKSHYKKLLRYIRVMDYIFNETKFQAIQFSLESLDRKFTRLYECYLNNWVDPPIVITKILCMGEKIFYNPSIRLIYESLFDNFIQETIYCVIYKKNFIDPQEFPRYMSCFEEVFDVTTDQNANLNARLKETEAITKLFESLKDHFELCHQELNKNVETLRPILENYLKNNKINFHELEKTANPTELKDLLAEFQEKEKIIKHLKPIVNVGIFEFQLDDLLELVSSAPRTWIDKMNKVIPNVLISKVRSSIERMSGHLTDLNVNPTDVESFIKLKKAVEACNKEKQLHEDMNNDIIDLQNIIDLNKEIKLQELDSKLIIELKDTSVKYDRKLDSTSYFIDNNIQQFRLDLKNEIKKFDDQIKNMMSELNNDVLNTYNEDSFNAIDYLEENSLKIKKCLMMKDKYQQQELDLEIDETMKSNFENLDNLVYEQQLKLNLWNSVKEFQDKKNEWESEKVAKINLAEMKELIKKWLDLIQVAMVDIDIPQVPIELKKKVQVYEQLVPVFEAIQNQNILLVPNLLQNLNELLRVEIKEENPLTCYQIRSLPGIFEKIEDIKELNFRANEERRLQDLIKTVKDTFYPRPIPMLATYNKPDFDKEFEFVEENLQMLNKIYLNKYCACVFEQLNKLTQEFNKYYKFLQHFTYYQKYIAKSSGIMENTDFMKAMPAEHKRLSNENLKKNLLNNWKDNRNIQKFLEHAYEKQMGIINAIIQSYEKEYKAISLFFDMKRNEIPRFYSLNNNDINEIYRERESKEVKQKLICKMFPWIKSIDIGDDQDEFIKFISIDDEDIQIKYSKNRILKELVDFLEGCLIRKLKDNFKSFKKEYETSVKAKGDKKPKEVINELIMNKNNLAQGIFNCMFYLTMDNLEKSLLQPDEAFDKLFDLYNEIKDEKIVGFINDLKKDDVTKTQKRILINLIFLFNYSKRIIELLIKEDVTTNNDFNFAKLISPKIENDTFMLHFMSFAIEYGYEYVGMQNNFLMIPESERMFLSLANAIYYKKPFQIYGLKNGTKKETLKVLANLCGKRINYCYTTSYFSLESFNKIYSANKRTGCWLCLDECQNINFDLIEILATRVADIYRIMQSNGAEEEDFTTAEEKASIKIHIFFYRELSYYAPFKSEEIPKVIKNYYKNIALPSMNYSYYLNEVLSNFGFENNEEITNKILYVMNYVVCKMNVMKHQYLIMQFLLKITGDINSNINNIDRKDYKLYLRNLLKEIFLHLLTEDEKEDFRKFLNEVFEMKDYKEDLPPIHNNNNEEEEEKNETEEEKVINEVIKKQFKRFRISNTYFEQQIKYLYGAIDNFDSFVITGPSFSGKTILLSLLHEVSSSLCSIDKAKFYKILNLRIFPKSKSVYRFFAENKLERAYRFNNNYFYNMISMFDEDNKEYLEKLNQHYSEYIGYKLLEEEEELTPEVLDKRFKEKEEEFQKEEEQQGMLIFQKDKNENIKEKVYKGFILDGQIDDTWLEYINNFYDKENFLALSDGDKINFRENFKVFFESASLKNTPPSFITKQIIVNCSYEKNGWESILYNWVEVNPKVTENTVLKNYIRGLFENYFPRIQDFIENNNIKSVTLSNNYIMKTLITIFDSIFPMFNFEDIKIGRKNFNVTPKIEIIKKCSLSMFIFSCAWTMNLLSNFVIKTKIEKLISDIFKADDLKGPIFDYYIDENTNDFELWSNILKDEYYNSNFEKGKKFNYGTMFIHTNETIPYFWVCEKLIDLNIAFFLNGKENSGKTFLLNAILDKKEEEELEVKKIKLVASYYTSPEDVEEYIFKNITTIKRDLFGDQFNKQTCLFIDDLNMNIHKDKYGTSSLLEFLREISQYKNVYDSKNNENRFLKKFSLCCCGNLTAYPNDDEFNRYLNQLLLITFVTSDDYFISIFKPSLEFHFRQYIPNTSGITSTQYLQASMKLNNFLKNEIPQDPKKLHAKFGIRDVINVIQTMHDFTFTQSEYPEYLKKIFFYQSAMVYESKLNKKSDIQFFRTKICEAYSSVFKQDKLTVADVFDDKWNSNNSYAFCSNYFNKDNPTMDKDFIFIENKRTLIDFVKSKIDVFCRTKDIKDKNYIKNTENNMLTVIEMLNSLEKINQNLILIGKECTGKKNLFELACFIAEVEIIEIDNSFSFETTKTKEQFLKEVIIPFLVNVTHRDKKSILYIPSTIKVDYVREILVKLIDKKEIINNFVFVDTQNYGEMTEEETMERLSKNILYCFDLVPKSEEYYTLFIDYPSLTKNSSVVYFHSWKNIDMTSYMGEAFKDLEIKPELKTQFSDILIQIFNYTSQVYSNFSHKININLTLSQKNFSDVCEFYSAKYSEYKNVLIEKQKKYNESFDIVEKVKELIAKTNKDIEESNPKRQELDKYIEEQKKFLNEKQREKNAWRAKKTNEDKIITGLNNQRKDKQNTLEANLMPFEEGVNKICNQLNKANQNDMMEIKNTWDSFNIGKYILTKICEALGEPCESWDVIKKNLDIKLIKNLIAVSPGKTKENKDKLLNITKEITGSQEFNAGDNKYNKPFKFCTTLCDFFNMCKRYYNEVDNQNELIQGINKIKEEIEGHQKVIKDIVSQVGVIDNNIAEIDKKLLEAETKKSNISGHLLKLKALADCFTSFVTTATEKLEIWKKRKENIDIILENYDFYLLIISCYIYYAAPLSYKYRKQYKQFLYALSQKLNLKNIKLLEIYSIFYEVLDSSGKDNEFCSSIGQYNEFLADNFTMMYIMENKIPYLIDNTNMCPEIISTFLEKKTPKVIVKAIYNGLYEQGDMFDKIEACMKNGNVLFIEQCEEGIYDIMENLIQERFTYNAEKGKNCYLIKNKKIEKNPKFKLYFVKSKPNSKISPKAFDNCYIINFNSPKYIINEYIYNSICKEQNPSLFQQVIKAKNDLSKDEFRLLELEKKILNYNKQFDLSYNLDKLDYNQNLSDKYNLETITHNTISSQINNNKIRLEIFKEQFKRFECISDDGSQLYKLLSIFFDYDILYMIPIDYLSDLLKEFYKSKFGLMKDLINKKKNKKKDNPDDDENNNEDQQEDEPDQEPEPEPENEAGGENENENENNEEKNEQKLLEELLLKTKNTEDEFPTYSHENSAELVIYLYNKISQIYDIHKRKYLLLLLLFFGLKQKEEIPSNFKSILRNINKLHFNKDTELNENEEENKENSKSPIKYINDSTWKALKSINECSSYIFSIIIDHIENHPQEWESFLDDDDMLIERKFNVADEDLSSTINPFTKFILFSIIKSHLSDSIITTTINDIINNDENPFIINYDPEQQDKKIVLEKVPNLEEVFFKNINSTRKPIIIIDKENGEIMYQKEIKELYVKKLKQTTVVEGKETVVESSVSFKEITPSKLEFSNNELDTIHNCMKNGGVVFIKNCNLVREAILKIIEEINDKENTVLNENFKLILLMNTKKVFHKYFYESCYFINRDILLYTQMKDFLLDLIKETPIELFNKLMNSENTNISAYYSKKLYMFFTIIYTVLIQYKILKSNIMKIPINFSRKEYFSCLKYLIDILASLIEEKQKELHNMDNSFGFTYESIIKIINDTLIYSKIITKEDYSRLENFLTHLFENSYFLKDDVLFAYDDFILMNIDEKRYPANANDIVEVKRDDHSNNTSSNALVATQSVKYCIPKSALLEQLERIPNEQYYVLMYGISNYMSNSVTDKTIKGFYSLVGRNAIDENKENNHKIMVNNIVERITELKRSLPDLLNTTEASSTLFKINKYNELFNPLDECLTKEIESYNKYLTTLYHDIDNLMSVINGNMLLISEYYDMIKDINNNVVPKKWKLSKLKNNTKFKDMDSWLNQIKHNYDIFNKWITDGFLNVYDLSIFNDEKLFITLLPIYFQKKMPESKSCSSDKIKINFKLTKYDSNEEITEDIVNEYKKAINNHEFIFIKGLRIKGFEGHKEEDKEIKSYKENIDNPNGELLPVIAVSYEVQEYQTGNIKNIDDEEESEEEEEISMSQEQKNEKHEENPKPSGGGGPKDGEEEEDKKDEDKDKNNGEEVVARKIVEATQIESKKVEIKVEQVSTQVKREVKIIEKTKIKYYKKHCRLEIPFVEERDENVYFINEPYGFIDIRFDCDKDKQEEYFDNKNIVLVLDK